MKKLVIILLFLPVFMSGQVYPDIEKLLRNKDFKNALNDAKRELNYAKAHKIAYLNLIIGTCDCVLKGKADKFDRIMENYQLDDKQELQLQKIRAKCKLGNVAIADLSLSYSNSFSSVDPSDGGSTKDYLTSGAELDRGEVITIKAPTRINPNSTAIKKSFALNSREKKKGLAFYKNLYRTLPGNHQYASKYFILNSVSNIKKNYLKKLAKKLDKTLEIYVREYQFKAPDRYISVHISGDPEIVRKQSELMYGFKISSGQIGYSSIKNFSIVSWYYDKSDKENLLRYTGTLQHEIMHILINYNAPYLPPWLAEGLPALCERTLGGPVKGEPNWRGERILSKIEVEDFPKNLLQMRWDEFGGQIDHDEEGVVKINKFKRNVNHASARYFVMYLQEKGKLKDLVSAFKNYHVGNDSFDKTKEEIFEIHFGKPFEESWKDYLNWFKTIPHK